MSNQAAKRDLTATGYVVLGIVDWLEEATPYEIKQRIEQSVSNFWPVPRSQVYAEAARLAKGGFLSERQERTGRRRKLYSLTKQGRSALAAWLRDADTSAPEYRDPGMLKLFFGADPERIAGPRVDHHRAKLEELKGYSEAMEDNTPTGVRTALDAGIAFHQRFIGFWQRYG